MKFRSSLTSPAQLGHPGKRAVKRLRWWFVSVCLSVTPSAKSTNFGSRYRIEGFSEWDKICQLDRGRLAVHHHPDWWTLAQEVPVGHQNSEGVKIIVTLFSYTIWQSSMKFGLVRDLTNGRVPWIWWTLAYFYGNKKLDSGYLGYFLLERDQIWWH